MHNPRPDHDDHDHDHEQHDDDDDVLDELDRRTHQLCAVLDSVDVLAAISQQLRRAARCLHPCGYDLDEFRAVVTDVERVARLYLDATRTICTRS